MKEKNVSTVTLKYKPLDDLPDKDYIEKYCPLKEEQEVVDELEDLEKRYEDCVQVIEFDYKLDYKNILFEPNDPRYRKNQTEQ